MIGSVKESIGPKALIVLLLFEQQNDIFPEGKKNVIFLKHTICI